MKEIREIVRAYKMACEQKKLTALATVVKVEGSAYRRPGARMLVTEDGQLTGAISGGCLEGDALKKALLVMQKNEPMLVKYDTNDDDDAKLGVGLGCNGIIYILIEPIISETIDNPVNFFDRFLKRRQHAVVVTLFNLEERHKPQTGTCLFLEETGVIHGQSIPQSLKLTITDDAKAAFHSKTSSIADYKDNLTDASYQAFIEVLNPPVILNIAGAGNDVMPLVNMAHILGWEVNIIDGRPSLLTQQRFPLATKLIHSKPDQILEYLQPDERTVFALLTHNYNYDLKVLKAVLPLSIPYVGVLGPKKKLYRILDELKEEGFQYSEGDLRKVHGPAGLDIGAETSEEIALSIISEIKSVLSNKKGVFLKDKQGPIHDTNVVEVKQNGNNLEKHQQVC